MSQGGTAPRPTSRRSSPSPARATAPATASSPPLRRSCAYQDDSRARPLQDPAEAALNRGDEREQQAGTRDMDRRSLLNPDRPYAVSIASQSPTFPPPSGPSGNPQSAMEAAQYGRPGSQGSPSAAFVQQARGATTPRSTSQAMPATTTSPAGGHNTSADRVSPQTVHPYPMAARRILTPRSPRAAGLSRAAMRAVEPQHFTASLPAPPAAQTHVGGPPPLGPPPQLHGSVFGQGTATPSPMRPTSGLARSLSQPSLSRGLPSAPHSEPSQPAGLKREHSGRPVLSGPPFAPPLPAGQPFGTSGAMGDSRWTSRVLTSLPAGAARNLQLGGDVQAVMAIMPGQGEEMLVPVDVYQASKVADQKRQRNAGASARFRQRKKEREQQQQEELQKLENQNRELEKKNEELVRRCQQVEAERDFYRSERNRLRDILSQTPGMKEWADRAPPSPISRTGGGGLLAPDCGGALPAQPAPLPPRHAHSSQSQGHPGHPTPYPQILAHPLAPPHSRSSSYGEPSALEPPARRRRTDSEPQLPTSSYSLATSTHLPPITAGPVPPIPAFSVPPSPHVTPPPGVARLPPLRFDQSRTPSTTPPPVPGVPPPQVARPQSASAYTTTARRQPYETGWAVDPRDHTEGGPR
ncbi:uncharacterized protein B0T15DRAFT_496623 [Chaetomium strumarium]|uniref:BZIP domain-containing protein n=1 Tax=Chaetomium strumarium TaxID=1170767 RepID=A0AAJ0GLL1_9PEZI|nr:hypothetical protein B0T15DRAFT_496623 [Chaetomium strumarium]